MRQFLSYHIIPIFLAVIVFIILALSTNDFTIFLKPKKDKELSATIYSLNSYYPNLNEKHNTEVQLVASLENRNCINLFGSSELTSASNYIPHKYFNDSLGLSLNSYGHAHHQSFAMFCELLALKKSLKGAKICVLISPGWFETDGTNIEAFLEFVKPSFLNNIIKDKSIKANHKTAIGDFLKRNNSLLTGTNAPINYFLQNSKYKNYPFVSRFLIAKANCFPKTNYVYSYPNTSIRREKNTLPDFNTLIKIAQANFLKNSSNNKIFVNNNYFNTYLKKDKKGNFENALYNPKITSSNQELKDLLLLIDLLKQSNCDASFVIQPLNPYYYNNIASFEPILNNIKSTLEKNNFPYLNLFKTNKADYLPGRLDDVMHLGDVGWLEVNQFLINTYHGKK